MPKKNYNKASIPLPSSSELRGKQSVRATFRLTEKSIEAINIVSVHLGIKQKSLFDHLIEDTEILNIIARDIRTDSLSDLNRTQKTYVLSRKTLTCLEEASKTFGTPRDALVEFSIQRLLPVIKMERLKHEKRKNFLKQIKDYLIQGNKLLKSSEDLLEEDDPVYVQFKSAILSLENTCSNIDTFVDKGSIIEDY